MNDPSNPSPTSTHNREWTVPLAIAALVLVVAGGFMHPPGAQQPSRFALTAALWDDQTVVLDDYTHLLGRDRAMRDGVTYSDKAPGHPFLGVPFYAVYRAAGGEPYRDGGDTGFSMWWLTFWTAAVPGALLAVLMYRWAREIEPSKALAATVTMSLGTLLLVYSSILYGHVLAALLVFSMFLVVRRPQLTRRQLVAAGLLGGAAVLVEYPVALIVAIVFVGAVVRNRSNAIWIGAGGLPAVVLLGLYTGRVTGRPFTLTYQWDAFSGPREDVGTLLDKFVGPNLDRMGHVLFSQRGLLIATPVIACAVAGLFLMWRRGMRFDSVVAGASFLSMLMIQFSWSNSYAGGAGPRYVTPALPFLAAGLAVAWARWRRTTALLAGFSVLTMMAAMIGTPQVGSQFEAGLGFWLKRISQGLVVPLVYQEALGGWAWLLYAVMIAGAIFVIATVHRRAESGRSEAELTSDPDLSAIRPGY